MSYNLESFLDGNILEIFEFHEIFATDEND